MSQQWHYSQDGAQYGPVDESEIVRLIQDGELSPSTPVCKEGGLDWQSAREHACFQVEIYPRKKTSTKVAASGETSQPATQTGVLPIIATSSPAGSFAPTVTNPVLTPSAYAMSGATILCLVIMLIITIGSVCFSFVKSQEGEGLILAMNDAESAAQSARSNEAKFKKELDQANQNMGKNYNDSANKIDDAEQKALGWYQKAQEEEAAKNAAQQENGTLRAEKQSWATERQNLQTKANEATIAQTKLAAAEAHVQTLKAERGRIRQELEKTSANLTSPLKLKLKLPTPPASIGLGVITGTRASARGKATVHSQLVFRFGQNEPVNILEEITLATPKAGEPRKWYRVQVPLDAGLWVHHQFLHNQRIVTIVGNDGKPSPHTYASVKPNRLNVHGGAGDAFPILGQLPQGTDVALTGAQKGKWLEIFAPGNCSVYVASQFVKLLAAPKPEEQRPPTLPRLRPCSVKALWRDAQCRSKAVCSARDLWSRTCDVRLTSAAPTQAYLLPSAQRVWASLLARSFR